MTDQLPPYPLWHHSERVRLAMLARDKRLLNKITRDYLMAYKSLDKQIKAAAEALANQPTTGRIYRVQALESLIEGVQREMQDYAVQLGADLDAAMAAEIQQALKDTDRLIYLQLPPGSPQAMELVVGAVPRIDPAAVTRMFGFLDDTGPLYANLQHKFAPALAEAIRDTIMGGFVEGMNPNTIGKLINKSFGVGLDWALNTARTAVLNAYRAASQQNYLAHSDVVKGWVWQASLDDRCCGACCSMHGSEHPVTETLADHHRGRCTALPITRSWAELGFEGMEEYDRPLTERTDEAWFRGLAPDQQARFLATSGEEWLKQQSLEVQQDVLGKAIQKAWEAGAFDFRDLPKQYYDPVYGRMWRQATLHELVGDEAWRYSSRYKRPGV